MKFYVTFGQKYARETHPMFPDAHPDGWIEVEADTEYAARCVVVQKIGTGWSSIYSEESWLAWEDTGRTNDELYPRGCIGKFHDIVSA